MVKIYANIQVNPLKANPTKWSNTLKYITTEDKTKEIFYLKIITRKIHLAQRIMERIYYIFWDKIRE